MGISKPTKKTNFGKNKLPLGCASNLIFKEKCKTTKDTHLHTNHTLSQAIKDLHFHNILLYFIGAFYV